MSIVAGQPAHECLAGATNAKFAAINSSLSLGESSTGAQQQSWKASKIMLDIGNISQKAAFASPSYYPRPLPCDTVAKGRFLSQTYRLRCC